MKKTQISFAIIFVIILAGAFLIFKHKENGKHFEDTIQTGEIHTVDPNTINTDSGGKY